MRILAVDTGSGTHDILLLDTSDRLENSVKMVVPSPTLRVANAIAKATEQRSKILFTGVTMGGGQTERGSFPNCPSGGFPALLSKSFDEDNDSFGICRWE